MPLGALFSGAFFTGPDRAQAASACVGQNPDFEWADFHPWYLKVDADQGADAELIPAAGYDSPKSARINITQRGTQDWHVQLSQRGIALSAGRRYSLVFWARADQDRVMMVQLQQDSKPYIQLWQQKFGLDHRWQRIETVLEYPIGAVTLEPVLRFDVGQTTGSVWIDDIALCASDAQPSVPAPVPVDGSCQIANGDFEGGVFSPWQFAAIAPAQATLGADTGARSPSAAMIDIHQSGLGAADVRLTQDRILLEPNTWMSLAFYARSSNVRTIKFVLRDRSGQLVLNKTVALVHPLSDASFRHHFITFKTPNDAASGAGTLEVQLNGSKGQIWLDGAHLCNAPQKFADEFEGNVLNTDSWTHCKAFTENCAEMNYGLQSWYKPSNAVVNNGTLKMRVTRETGTVCIGCKYGSSERVTRDYATVYIQTSNAFATQYGYFEARMKMTTGLAQWPAFWTHPPLDAQGNVRWPPEIDILEYYTNRPGTSWQTLHYNTSTQFNVTHGQQYLTGDLAGEFHTYSVNWTPNEIIWYVDGAETFRSSRYLVREPMFVILDVEVGGPAGRPDPKKLGDPTEVDYVRVFDNSRAFVYDGTVVNPPTPVPTPIKPPPSKPTPPTSLVQLQAQVLDEATQSPLRRWRIQAFDGNQLVQERDTDANGWATLSVAPGQYRICEMVALGWRNTTPGDSGCYWMTLRAGDTPVLTFRNAK